MKKWQMMSMFTLWVKMGQYGGSYKVTKDLYEKLEGRVLDTQ